MCCLWRFDNLRQKSASDCLDHIPRVFHQFLLCSTEFQISFLSVLGSPAGCFCVAAGGASATAKSHLPWMFGSCLVCFMALICVHEFKYLCAGFRVSQYGASMWLHATLWRPRKNAPLEYWGMDLVGSCKIEDESTNTRSKQRDDCESNAGQGSVKTGLIACMLLGRTRHRHVCLLDESPDELLGCVFA